VLEAGYAAIGMRMISLALELIVPAPTPDVPELVSLHPVVTRAVEKWPPS
jgi:hypothetical protein